MGRKTKKVAIVIPFHKSSVSEEEKVSIKHLVKYLGSYDKFLVLPESIKKVSFKIPKAQIVNFQNEYFTSVPKYCELLNTSMFYKKFLDYAYILIYQLDVLVFSDQLLYWCTKGYDFVGAPFIFPLIGMLSHKKGSPVSGGNGGFSLRRVRAFIKVIEAAEELVTNSTENQLLRKLWFILAVLSGKSHRIWLQGPPHDYPFNEDGFWSYEAAKYYPEFKVAPFKEALKFSFEKNPRKCFELNSNKLPFGCHAWAKYDKDFWEPYLLK